MSAKLKVVAYATDREHPGFRDHLAPSCERHGLDLVVLPEKPHPGRWTNRLKDRWLGRFLRRLPPDEIVLSTDGYDCVLLGGGEEILAKHATFDRPVVFSAEQVCWPKDPRVAARFPSSRTSVRYLNSGGFIGPAGTLRHALRHARWRLAALRHRRSNQYLWAVRFLDLPDVIALDYDRRLFCCVSFPNRLLQLERCRTKEAAFRDPAVRRAQVERLRLELSVEAARIRCLPGGERPCHLHFPNGALCPMMEDPFLAPLRTWDAS